MKRVFVILMLALSFSTSVLGRYKPMGKEIVCVNGKNRFTRAIYGTNTPFRFETSDFPEVGMYMPNLGGSMYFALSNGETSQWIADMEYIESSYEAGKRSYSIRDTKMLGERGTLKVTFLALADADGMIVKMEPHNLSKPLEILSIYGGANDEHFRREGDLGADRADCFHIKEANCKGNQYRWINQQFMLTYGPRNRNIAGVYSASVIFHTSQASALNNLDALMQPVAGNQHPVLVGRFPLKQVEYISLLNPESTSLSTIRNHRFIFEAAEKYRKSVADKVRINTPDAHLNPVGSNLAMAADAVWQAPVYHHGSIGWRIPLLGWRHCYIGDFLGWKERARSHFDYYAALQFTNMPDKSVMPDTTLELARPSYVIGTPMYSSGYIPNCQENELYFYDMNLGYIDALLWHLNWTGDLAYARKIWPVIERHLAWEKRTFDPDGDGLYDALCCIWASDALQYNGGSVTHSSAYNYRANKMAALIADKIGVDGTKYREEAERIYQAIDHTLWLSHKGWWAEYKGKVGNTKLHESAAAWTFYHTIDSELSEDNLQGYQAARYALKGLPHIPVLDENQRETGYSVVSTTNWMPYEWSVNNVALAESTHTALALFQTGMNEEAYKLMKGAVIDVMYQGKSPGNFGMTTSYDILGEVYRDFSDGVGIFARLLVQGLFGLSPDALNGKLHLMPGFPQAWNEAEIETSDYRFSFHRQGRKDTYTLSQKNTPLHVALKVPARYSRVSSVRINGKKQVGRFVNHVGKPLFVVECAPTDACTLEIEWGGAPIEQYALNCEYAQGDPCQITLQPGVKLLNISDPQGVVESPRHTTSSLEGRVRGELGARTLFMEVAQGDARWMMPLEMEVKAPLQVENLDESGPKLNFRFLNHSVTEQTFTYLVNGKEMGEMHLTPRSVSEAIQVEAPLALMGTNRVEVRSSTVRFEGEVTNWHISNPASSHYAPISMQGVLNDRVTQIFEHRYLSPRYTHTTLQIPMDGYGDWCVPLRRPKIDDSGLRNQVQDGIYTIPMGIPFLSTSDSLQNNIAFTSLWDNFPTELSLTLTGRARHLYLLMAGSTNHMQSRFVNGVVSVRYKDGTCNELKLVNPDTWVPIEQDFYIDQYAYKVNKPRPYRVLLKEGILSRDLTKDKNITLKTRRMIDGGAGVLLDLPLNPDKELDSLTWKTEAYEVVIGLMGATLMR